MAGMQIYERIATKLPQISLSALYNPMLKALDSHHTRHPYIECVGKYSQKSFSASRPEAISLVNICQNGLLTKRLFKLRK